MGNAPGSMRAQPWMALSCEVTRPRRRRTESSLGQRCQGAGPMYVCTWRQARGDILMRV